MKIAVTGASGLVGGITARHLTERGHEVVGIDRVGEPDGASFAQFIQADLTDYAGTREALEGVDAVVHLAAINAPIVAPQWVVHNTNVVSSYNVLFAAADLKIGRVVQASSVNAIGLAWSRKPRFDYFPIDLNHPTYNEDGYSLSKLAQELQADSITRRWRDTSVVSLRLHAVLESAAQAQLGLDHLGLDWAVNGLFGYCTYTSVATAIESACSAEILGHEVLWVVEPETFTSTPSAELAYRFFPEVPTNAAFQGRGGFFDISRTRAVLDWRPDTELNPPEDLVTI